MFIFCIFIALCSSLLLADQDPSPIARLEAIIEQRFANNPSIPFHVVTKAVRRQHNDHPYATEQAHVRIGNELCADEEQFLAKRHKKVKAALEDLLQMKLADDEVPSIAVCASGGGYRATIATLGFLQGFSLERRQRGFVDSMVHYLVEAINYFFPESETVVPEHYTTHLGLLDVCTYSCTISGSAWAVAGLLQSYTSVDDYIEKLSTTLDTQLYQNVDVDEVVVALLKKYSYGQPMSLIDVWGALIAQKFLKFGGNENQNAISVMTQTEQVDSGEAPLPIYAAVTGNTPEYEWVEFTPYEVGSANLNAYIPLWAFGRKFEHGVSQDYLPPQTLGYCMGVWGSGISANVKEFFEQVVQPMTGSIITKLYLQPKSLRAYLLHASMADTAALDLCKLLLHNVDELPTRSTRSLFDYRISPAQVYNWCLNSNEAQLNNMPLLTLVDAGVDFNLPIPPLLNRKRPVDIMIMFDMGIGKIGYQFNEIQAYARQKGLAFPTINMDIIERPCSIHKDASNPDAPVVIYMTLIQNLGYHNGWNPKDATFTYTYNFKYSKEQIDLLSGLTCYNMQQSQEMIVETIRQWILEKRARTTT